jgi:hypothetical protein
MQYAVQTKNRATGLIVSCGEAQSDRNLCELWAETSNKQYPELSSTVIPVETPLPPKSQHQQVCDWWHKETGEVYGNSNAKN